MPFGWGGRLVASSVSFGPIFSKRPPDPYLPGLLVWGFPQISPTEAGYGTSGK